MKDVLDEARLICLDCGKEYYADIDSECYKLEMCPECYEDFLRLEEAELQDLKDSETKQIKKGLKLIRDLIFEVVTRKENLDRLKTAFQEEEKITQEEIDKIINDLENIRRKLNIKTIKGVKSEKRH